jgi:hypothetical protein
MTDTIDSLEEKIRTIKLGTEYQNLVTKHRGPLEERRLRELNMRINAFETQKKSSQPASTPKKPGHSLVPVSTNAAGIRVSHFGALKAKPRGGAPVISGEKPRTDADMDKQFTETVTSPPIFVPAPMAAPLPALVRGMPASARPKSFPAPVHVVEINPPKPKLAPAMQKGMAPPPKPAPVTKMAGVFTSANKVGKAISRGSVKASAPATTVSASRAPSLSKSPAAFIKPAPENKSSKGMKSSRTITKKGDSDEDLADLDNIDDLMDYNIEDDNINFEGVEYETIEEEIFSDEGEEL